MTNSELDVINKELLFLHGRLYGEESDKLTAEQREGVQRRIDELGEGEKVIRAELAEQRKLAAEGRRSHESGLIMVGLFVVVPAMFGEIDFQQFLIWSTVAYFGTVGFFLVVDYWRDKRTAIGKGKGAGAIGP